MAMFKFKKVNWNGFEVIESKDGRHYDAVKDGKKISFDFYRSMGPDMVLENLKGIEWSDATRLVYEIMWAM